jgi:threonine dehydratase
LYSGTLVTVDITRTAIEEVDGVVAPYIRRTPTLDVNGLDIGLGAFPLTLKLELFQVAGSFKSRGAFANLLMRDVPPAGVVAASGGNHGAAVAYAANRLGRPARIYVPSISSPAKIDRIRSYGRDLQIVGDRAPNRSPPRRRMRASRAHSKSMLSINARRCSGRERSAASSRRTSRSTPYSWRSAAAA